MIDLFEKYHNGTRERREGNRDNIARFKECTKHTLKTHKIGRMDVNVLSTDNGKYCYIDLTNVSGKSVATTSIYKLSSIPMRDIAFPMRIRKGNEKWIEKLDELQSAL